MAGEWEMSITIILHKISEGGVCVRGGPSSYGESVMILSLYLLYLIYH